MVEHVVELKNISKSFPGVKALEDVSFDLRPGEVHALLGENGAGKSTLMKILSGIYERDTGEFKVDGISLGHVTPKKAQEMGIAIIHQELNMCQHLTVAENMFLAREDLRYGMLNQKLLNEKAKAVLEKLRLEIDPATVMSKLSVAKQQMVEIAKALSTNARILIMDEPTSALTEREIKELFRIIQELKEQGKGIVYISHRLEELKGITDRITILRDGKYIITKNFKETTIQEIIAYMVGREIKEKYPRVQRQKGEKIFEVRHLSAGKILEDINFELYAGEIIGFAGLMGAGRTELMRVLFGVDHMDEGEILLNGRSVKISSPIDAIKQGIVCVPEDRKKEGLCTKLTIQENIALANLDLICNKLGMVNHKKEVEMAQKAIEELKIKTPSTIQEVKNLSGGNQQKVVVGKWLVRDAKVVIFDEPTRGIDVAAKIEIYNLMNKLKQEGIGVMFVSSELPEILGMSDKVIVMCDGRVTGEMAVEEASQDKILSYATQYQAKKEVVGDAR